MAEGNKKDTISKGMTWLKANIQINKVDFKNKESTPKMRWMVMDRADGGDDGGGVEIIVEDISHLFFFFSVLIFLLIFILSFLLLF